MDGGHCLPTSSPPSLCDAKEEERDSKSILPPTTNVGMCASMRNRPTPPDSLSHLSNGLDIILNMVKKLCNQNHFDWKLIYNQPPLGLVILVGCLQVGWSVGFRPRNWSRQPLVVPGVACCVVSSHKQPPSARLCVQLTISQFFYLPL